MACRCSALTGLMVVISALAGPVLAQQITVTIEEINTVVFPADGAEKLRDCLETLSPQITMEESIRSRAEAPIRRMLEMSK